MWSYLPNFMGQSTETAHLASLLAGHISTRRSGQAQEIQKSGRFKVPQLTDEEAFKLKQEILQQEVLIRGYQVHFGKPIVVKFFIPYVTNL